MIEDGQFLGLAYLLALVGFLFGIGAFRFWVTWALGAKITSPRSMPRTALRATGAATSASPLITR